MREAFIFDAAVAALQDGPLYQFILNTPHSRRVIYTTNAPSHGLQTTAGYIGFFES